MLLQVDYRGRTEYSRTRLVAAWRESIVESCRDPWEESIGGSAVRIVIEDGWDNVSGVFLSFGKV